jgi:hypothetical protein
MARATVISQDYLDGWADGEAGRDPAFDRLALGWNHLNDYERGYVDSGQAAYRFPVTTPGGAVKR